ncbi:MAG: FAD-binding oxidoreductase [Dehalobacterium sp.]
MKTSFNIKTNRVFSPIRKYSWIFTLLVGIGGLWFPKLGLLVILVILSLLMMSFFKGRYWCGNFCPHGSLFDSIIMPVSRNKHIPSFLKSKIWVALFFIWFGFNMGRKILKVSAIFGTLPFWDKLGYVFVTTYLMVIITGGLLSLFVAPRTWCQFCPMGTMQKGSYKLGKLLGIAKHTDEKITIKSKNMCHTCGKCSRVCPMQLSPYLEFSEKNQFDHEACIRCNTCVNNCPAGILSLSNEARGEEIKNTTSLKGYEKRKPIQALVENIRHLSEDVIEYMFKFQTPEVVKYEPGQFILVKIQDHPKMFRAFSISSYHEDSTRLSITMKKMPGGYGSGIIPEKFQVGDSVELEGPMGHELVINKNAKKVLLVAGGIGITPFRAIVKDLVENSHNIESIQLIYGVNKEKEFLYLDEFKGFEDQSNKFTFIQVVASDENWSGKKGFVTDVMKDMDLKDYEIYMCGPKPMINATLKTLKAMGVKEEIVFYESA